MDSYEFNKIVGALLFTCLVLVALKITAGAIFSPHKPAKPGYEIAVQEHPEKGDPAPAAKEEPLPVRLASASIEKGKARAKICVACHSFEKGGPNKVGPNLWGIVGRKHASLVGFAYSETMKKMTGEWTFVELDHFLENPKGMVPGTKMTFNGLRRGSERADIIAYLNTLSDNPQPLPKAAEKPAAPALEKAAEKPATESKAAAAPAAAPAAPAASPSPAAPPAPAESPAAASPPPAASPAPAPAAPAAAPAEQKPQ